MDSWLKAAEGFLEVVDRKAKQAAGEKPDEYSDSWAPASNGKGSQPKRTKPRKKVVDAAQVQTSARTAKLEASSDKDGAIASVEYDRTHSSKSFGQISGQQQQNADKDPSSIASSETPANEIVKHEVDRMEVPLTISDSDPERLTTNGEVLNEKASDVSVDHPSLVLTAKETETMNEENGGQNDKLKDADAPSEFDQERSPLENNGSPTSTETALEDGDPRDESLVDQKKPLVHEADNSPMKLQDQLDEAQGLLKTAVSTSQSKEARLARVCTGLHARIQAYKYENAQLEELLSAEGKRNKSYEAHIKQLQQDLSVSKSEVTRVESNMVGALAMKNSEIEALVSSMDALKKQAALSEGNLASLQANMESMLRSRELTETRMIQGLREELTSAEWRAEEERAAHNATKMSATERQEELERRAVEESTALARVQRVADERTAKATELEQKLALLEVEYASLNQELQDMEARARHGQKKPSEEANQVLQMQAWQEELEQARQGQRAAESKLSSVEAEVQKMRAEMAAMKRDAEHYSRQEHMELEKRYRELTDLLYYKQTQLEAMASEKAAAEFQLEKELKRLHEAQVDAERSRVSRRSSSTWEEDTEMKALEPLPLYHRHMAAASIQLQKAAKLLDSGAARATSFLWQYPTARLILLFYLVSVHLFLMYLLHRLQLVVAICRNKRTIFLIEKLHNLWDWPPIICHENICHEAVLCLVRITAKACVYVYSTSKGLANHKDKRRLLCPYLTRAHNLHVRFEDMIILKKDIRLLG